MEREHGFGRLLLMASAFMLSATTAWAQGFRRPEPLPPQDPMRFEFVGSADGGRISSVAGVEGASETYYAGAASGGVWKTTDGGKTWLPMFDKEPVQSIGALAVAPSDSMTVWAGTGEAWAIRDADIMGDGVHKSTDGGKTWTHMGLAQTGRISQIIIDPKDANTVFVCALGRTTGPQQERGVYRTKDGGATWQRVLFVDPNTGCSGMSMDAKDPNTLFAGTWQVVMHTWVELSGGPGGRIYVSHDGGDHWTQVKASGLPKPPVGKVDVAVAPTDPNRVYALIQTDDQGSVWRSDDGGKTWQVVSWDRTLIGRAGYYIRLKVSPADENEILLTNSSLHLSKDGGHTWTVVRRGCGDCHDIWWDPTNADRYAVTGDGGLGITTDHGKTVTSVALPVAQFYHVAVDDQIPYWIYGNRQDDGTMRGPSDEPELPDNVPLREYGGGGAGRFGFRFRRPSAWQHGLGGCESGFTLPVPGNPDIIYASCYGDEVTRFDARVGLARDISPYMHTLDSPPDSAKYRCHWTPPLAVDPFAKETVYYGCQVIFKTSDGGQTWSVISPDLSTQDPSRIVSSGGVTKDNLGQFYGEVVFAIAPSPIQQGLIWAGTNDGKVWYTRDGGGHWTDVTKNITGMPAWGTVRKIQPSYFDPTTAYVAVDLHLMDDRDPYIYKTTDYGQTWTKVTGNLPAGGPLDYVMAVTEDRYRKGMLFAGTGHGFYYSRDDGQTWTHLQTGLPASPVSWIVMPQHFHDVVVSTYGRGVYILHDISPLEQADQVTADEALHLFQPGPGYRKADSGLERFRFLLRQAPSDSIPVEILDGAGHVVRHMTVAGRQGRNGANWDLHYDPPVQVALRTVAPDNPHIWDEPRFKGQDTRPVIHWGIEAPQHTGPIAAPGKYTVRLSVGGRSYTRPFEVLKDQTIAASDADLVASTAAQVRAVAAIDSTAGMINRIEVVRKQITDLRAANQGKGSVVKALDGLNQQAFDVELQLISRHSLDSDDKWYVMPYKIYLNLIWLYGALGPGAGDVAAGAAFPPTDATLATLSTMEQRLGQASAAFDKLMSQDLPAFNRRMNGKLPPVSDRVAAEATGGG
jgi:photosystem II stability/assembly factor-like uncharacterized protein